MKANVIQLAPGLIPLPLVWIVYIYLPGALTLWHNCQCLHPGASQPMHGMARVLDSLLKQIHFVYNGRRRGNPPPAGSPAHPNWSLEMHIIKPVKIWAEQLDRMPGQNTWIWSLPLFCAVHWLEAYCLTNLPWHWQHVSVFIGAQSRKMGNKCRISCDVQCNILGENW